MRTLVIGDIHGNLSALKGVLKEAKFDLNRDRIITLGDYIMDQGCKKNGVLSAWELETGTFYQSRKLL